MVTQFVCNQCNSSFQEVQRQWRNPDCRGKKWELYFYCNPCWDAQNKIANEIIDEILNENKTHNQLDKA